MVKFAIWGIGRNGKYVFRMLKKENIIAIIDEGKEWVGKKYEDIEVMQSKEFFLKYPYEIPIIVTPGNSEKKIEKILQLENRKLYFLFSSNQVKLEGFLLQAPIDKMIQGLSDETPIVIYGMNLLALVMYNFFASRYRSVYICLQNGYCNENIDKLEMNQINFDEISNDSVILLSMEILENDEKEIANKKHIEKYYDLGTRKALYHNTAIEKFKGIHKGKRCFIVATGPSLKIKDLDILARFHEICIGMNGVFYSFPHTEWRPNYYIVSGASCTIEWEQQILDMNVEAKFVADVAWVFKNNSVPNNVYKWHFQREWDENRMPEFSDDFSRISYMGYTVTYDGALQLATYMGFEEIYLIGVDCMQYGSNKQQHFVENYDKNSNDKTILQIENNLLAYQSAQKYADEHGIQIYNATRGGALEVFPRVEFESLF
jgi:hypothetical protein